MTIQSITMIMPVIRILTRVAIMRWQSEDSVSGQELSMNQMFHIAMPAQYIITVLMKYAYGYDVAHLQNAYLINAKKQPGNLFRLLLDVL